MAPTPTINHARPRPLVSESIGLIPSAYCAGWEFFSSSSSNGLEIGGSFMFASYCLRVPLAESFSQQGNSLAHEHSQDSENEQDDPSHADDDDEREVFQRAVHDR